MASAQANRTFGVTFSGGVNAAILNFTTAKGRLHAATGQDIVHPNNYANVQWVAGPSESTGSIIAYAKFNAEGNPVVVSTIGDHCHQIQNAFFFFVFISGYFMLIHNK